MSNNNKFLKDLGFSDEWIAQISSKDMNVFQEQQVNYEFSPVCTVDVSELIINSDDSPYTGNLLL